MKLDQTHRDNLAANLSGFMAARKLSYSTVQPVLKINGNTIWKYAQSKRNSGILQDETIKTFARGLGVSIEALIGTRINWKNGGQPREPQPRAPLQERVATTAPTTSLFTIELSNGRKINVAKGMEVSVLSADYIRIR